MIAGMAHRSGAQSKGCASWHKRLTDGGYRCLSPMCQPGWGQCPCPSRAGRPLPPRCSPLLCLALTDSFPSLFNYFTRRSAASFSGSEANCIRQVLE